MNQDIVWEPRWEDMPARELAAKAANSLQGHFYNMLYRIGTQFEKDGSDPALRPVSGFLREHCERLAEQGKKAYDIRRERLTDYTKGRTLESSVRDSAEAMQASFAAKLLFSPKPVIVSLSCEEIRTEERRVRSIFQRIAKENGIEAPELRFRPGGDFVLTQPDGKGRQAVSVNVLLVKQLTDDELAFVAGKGLARVALRQEEEEEVLRNSFEHSLVPREYRSHLFYALRRKNEYESDRVGLGLALKAGFKKPESLGFLLKGTQEYTEAKKAFVYRAECPAIAEREIALRNTKDLGFNKKENDAYIDHISRLAEDKRRFVESRLWTEENGKKVYKGLYVPEQEWCIKQQYAIEKEMLKRVIPSVRLDNSFFKKHVEELEQGSVMEKMKASLFMRLEYRELVFEAETLQNRPERQMFAEEVKKTAGILTAAAKKISQSIPKWKERLEMAKAVMKTPKVRLAQEAYEEFAR